MGCGAVHLRAPPNMKFGHWPFKYASERGETSLPCSLLERRPDQIGRDFVEQLIKSGTQLERAIRIDVGGYEDVARGIAENHIANGVIDQLKELVSGGLLPSQQPFLIDRAAAAGNLEVIQFLEKINLAIATTDAMDQAAKYKKWSVVKYLHGHRSEGCTTRVMDAAAKQGQLDELKFDHENRSEGCTTNAMDDVTSNGALKALALLHQNRSEGCTTRPMDEAVGKGYLPIVKFLHDHRPEGCTTKAIEKATRGGHVEVVKFLLLTRGESVTLEAIKTAIESGELEVIAHFDEHSPSLFGPEFLHGLLLRGVFSIWKDLRVVYPDEANAVVEAIMFEAGKETELRTIHFVVKELGREDLAHVAVDGVTDKTEMRSGCVP